MGNRLTGNNRVVKITSGKIVAGITGITLLAGYIFTGIKGVSAQDQDVYENALNQQEQIDEMGFLDFKLTDYPVAMYDGTSDYVFYDGEIEKRKPVLETFAGTAYPVGDHFEVIIPTLERMDGVLSLAGGVESMTTGSGYGAKEQTATMWHEAFHAWQLSNFQILGESITPEELEADLNADTKETGETEEEILVKEVDQKKELKADIKKEMQFLEKTVLGSAMSEGNIDEIKKAVLEYKELVNERRAQMSEDAVQKEIRCELTEGTAYYVEANCLKTLKGNDEYQKRYMETLDKFEGGRGKYYRTGMAKCLILDRLTPEWKTKLDFTKSLDELLDNALL